MKSYPLLLTVGLMAASCDKVINTDNTFLRGTSKAVVVEEKIAMPKPEKEQVAAIAQTILVKSEDWDRLTLQVKKFEAERNADKARMILEIEAATSTANAACLKDLEVKVSERAARAARETVEVAEDFKNELLKYKFDVARVNGDCVGKMVDGRTRSVRVQGDACLKAPFVKIGTLDGEIKGIEGAVSADAMASGIVSLNCDIGRAHITMSNTPCGDQAGAAIKSSFSTK